MATVNHLRIFRHHVSQLKSMCACMKEESGNVENEGLKSIFKRRESGRESAAAAIASTSGKRWYNKYDKLT